MSVRNANGGGCTKEPVVAGIAGPDWTGLLLTKERTVTDYWTTATAANMRL